MGFRRRRTGRDYSSRALPWLICYGPFGGVWQDGAASKLARMLMRGDLLDLVFRGAQGQEQDSIRRLWFPFQDRLLETTNAMAARPHIATVVGSGIAAGEGSNS